MEGPLHVSGFEALTLFTARQFLLWLGLEVIYCIQGHVTECVGPMLSALLTIILEAPTHPHAPQPPNTTNPECDGQFYVSICLGCCTLLLNQTLTLVLQGRYYVDVVNLKEITLDNVGGPHPIS